MKTIRSYPVIANSITWFMISVISKIPAMKPIVRNSLLDGRSKSDGMITISEATTTIQRGIKCSVIIVMMLALAMAPAQTNGQIKFRGKASAAKRATSGTLFTINKPGGVVAGDVMILSSTAINSTTFSGPSDWILLRQTTIDNFFSSSGGTGYIYYKIAGANEPASYTFTVSSGSSVAVGLMAFSGVDISNATPFDGNIPQLNRVTDNACYALPVTTENDSAAVIMISMIQVSSTPYINWTTDSPGDLSLIYGAIADVVGSSAHNAAAWAIKPFPGSTGVGSFGVHGILQSYSVMIPLKYRPAIPIVSNISPLNGCVGTTVTVTGAKFKQIKSVALNGTNVDFVVNSPSEITFTLPPGVDAGPITVTNGGGTATSPSNFTPYSTVTPGELTCPFDKRVKTNAGVCFATNVTLGTPTKPDNCTVSTIVASFNGSVPNSATSYVLGDNTVTWTATDAYGNSTSCDQIVTVATPEISVVGNSVPIVDGDVATSTSNNTDFGNAVATKTVSRTFTIHNELDATDPLTISGITVTGADASLFTVGAVSPGNNISINGSATFTVSFTPTTLGIKNATIHIANNDCDESVYDFAIRGTSIGTAPTINYPHNPTVQPRAGECTARVIYSPTVTGAPAPVVTYQFSGATIGNGNGNGANSVFNPGVTTVTLTAVNPAGTSSCSFTVTVKNLVITCPGDIETNATGLCGAEVVLLGNPTAFDNCVPVTPVATLAGNPVNYFTTVYPLGTNTVIWTATGANGTVSCSQTITVLAPEADVQGNNVDIVDGDATPDVADHTIFDDAIINNTVTRTYTIQNTGNMDLRLNNVTISGADFVMFTADSYVPGSMIPPGGSATFIINFRPTSTGIKNAIVRVSTTDCDETIYDFAIRGTGFIPSVTCPGNIVAEVNSLQTAVVSYAVSSTGILAANLSYSFVGVTTGSGTGTGSGSTFNKGITTVTITGTYATGTANCSFTVEVKDFTPSNITCIPPQFISLDPSTCSAMMPNYTSSFTYTGGSTITYGFVEIEGGDEHSLGVRADGSLWTWGFNNAGQLGDGTVTSRRVPTKIGTDKTWAKVSGGTQYSLAIKTDGSLWAWGLNNFGQLGDGTNTNKSTPVQVGTDKNWVAISAGAMHSLAIKSDGTLWSWGYNADGELGDGTNTDRNFPAQVGSSSNWATIAGGMNHSLAVASDGSLWGWGQNFDGEIGDGTRQGKKAPVRVGTDNNWSRVAAGDFHSLGVKSDGTLWAWGSNSNGQLAQPTSIADRVVPTQVGTANTWKAVSAGSTHSIATTSTGELWGWGANNFFQLGDGTNTQKNVPVQVSTNFDKIASGLQFNLGIKLDGKLVAWGNNNRGQYGDNTITRQSTPVTISIPSAVQSPAGGTIIQPGITPVTLTVTDAGGGISTCTFNVTAAAPEINILGGLPAIAITDGNTITGTSNGTDLGEVSIGTARTATYTVQNTGTDALNLTGITLTGADAASFSTSGLTPASPIPVGGTATFDVIFTPAATGVKLATVNIASNDCDEAIYDFAITGTGKLSLPLTNCPANIRVDITGGCNAVVNYSSSSSGIPAPTITYVFSGATTGSGSGDGSGATFNIGTTLITLTATNSNGSANCSFEVVVNDDGRTPGTTTTITACDSYLWAEDGTTYTESGTYYALKNCTVQTLELTITPTTTTNTNITACGSYTWPANGVVYTNSGTYQIVNGCAIQTLNLVINPLTTHTNIISACNSYTWSETGTTYTSSGTYESLNGCAKEILNLNITTSTTHTTPVTACISYTWPVNGVTYTSSGLYQSVNGCATEILDLTITPGSIHSVNIATCDSYTWPANGQTYTGSGTYEFINGCTIEVLELTITGSSVNTTSLEACGSYTWPVNGVTYTQSGTYNFITGCNTETLELTVNPLPTLGVTVSPSASICRGSSVTLIGTGATSYIWSDGITNGVAFVPNITATFTVTGIDDKGCENTASQTVTVVPTTWTGATNTLWSVAGNWSCGLPSANAEILVPNTVNKPVLDMNYTVDGSLTMQPGAILTINPNIILSVTGTANFNGQPVIFKSDATGTASLGTSSGIINGADNATVERYLPVANVATGRSWRLLTIPVKSSTKTIRDAWAGHSANSNAPAGEAGGSGTLITGQAFTNGNTAVVAGYDWWPAISGAASSIRRYTITGNSGAWTATPSTTTLLNAAEEGYMLFVRGDRTVTTGSGFTTLRPNGTLRTGTQTYSIPAPATAAYKVMGNPYPATISFESLMSHGSNSSLANSERFWQWDANLGTNGAYRLITKQGAGSWLRVPAAFTDPSPSHAEYISSSQAFIIETLASGNNFTIEESDKPATLTGNPPSVFDISNMSRLYANLNLDNGNNKLTLADGILASFDLANNNSIDRYDAAKVDNFNENMGIIRNGKQLTLEARKTIINTDTIFFQMKNLQVRNYALQFKAMQLEPGLVAVLQDAYTGKEVNVSTIDNDITTYNFTVSSAIGSAAADRFRIIFKAGQVLPLTLTNAKAYSLNSGVQIDWNTVNERGVKSYEVEKGTDGRNFSKAKEVTAQNGVSNSYGWYDAAPVKGNNYYRIKGISASGEVSFSQVLLVNLSGGKASFTLYPNPVKGNRITLQLSNMAKGKYAMTVYNAGGQRVLSKDITHLGGSATEEIDLGSAMASGVYRVSLTCGNGNAFNQSLMLQR